MRFVVCCLLIVVAGAIHATGQSATPQPTPYVNPQPTPTPFRPISSGLDRMMGRREAARLTPAEEARYQQYILSKYVDPIFRKPTKQELAAVEVDAAVLSRYKDFLKTPNSDIFKLVKDHGCDQNTAIVSASEECRVFSMPGGGNAYSFRIGNYRLRRYGDLSVRNGLFFVPGIFMHGILTVLGDEDPIDITLDSPGMAELQAIEPSTTKVAATEFGAMLAKGFERGGRLFAANAAVKLNTAYGLRVIAYRGKQMRAVVGATYNELERDKRRDVLVVFRVVNIDADGTSTIIYRVLLDKESPELKNER